MQLIGDENSGVWDALVWNKSPREHPDHGRIREERKKGGSKVLG